MAQYLKDEIQQSINAAALSVFARKGYEGATMAEIGKAAGVSTGNIYRYYENKEVLFYALINDAFVERFVRLVRRRVASLEGVSDVRTLGPAASFHLVSEELLAFAIENRLQVVILLGKAQGTRFAPFAEETIGGLSKLAIDHFRAINPALRVTRTMRFNLEQIYRNLLGTLVNILTHFDEEAQIREAVAGYSKYHLLGLTGFFE